MSTGPKSIMKQPKASFKHAISRSDVGTSTAKNTHLNSKSARGNGGRGSGGRKPLRADEDDDDEEGSEEGDDGSGEEGSADEVDTDEEIVRGKSDGKEKKGTKRKRPATTAETFGSTLTSLLVDSTAPKKQKQAVPQGSTPILSLSQAKPPPSKAAENLERKAKRHLQALKEEKEDRARIRDVVEGWSGGLAGGQEFEKGLRKTAQRGVIKLFNAILVASKNAEAATTSLSARAGVKDEKAKGKKEKDNILGRGGKEAPLTQEGFLDLVRRG